MNKINLECLECQGRLFFDKVGWKCEVCGAIYKGDERTLETNFLDYLLRRFKRKYLLSAVLNANGERSYSMLKEGSISLGSREDVIYFREFMRSNGLGHIVLDVGAGVLPLPGYFDEEDIATRELIGLDIIKPENYRGFRILGCSEQIPLKGGSVDTVVFATSIDHVVSIKNTIFEVARVLAPGGLVYIWMSDRSLLRHPINVIKSIYWKFRARAEEIVKRENRFEKKITSGCVRIGRYVVYPSNIVFYIPHGAVDPFHSFIESPKQIVNEFRRSGFSIVKHETLFSQSQHFIALKR